MRTVVVSSYPPRHCGIGAYAATRVSALRAGGAEVVVISPPDGEGDVRVPFTRGRPFREAVRRSGRRDEIVVHFQPALYDKRRDPVAKVLAAARLLWLVLRRRRTEILVHEADPPRWWRPDHLLLGAAFRASPSLAFHTAAERRAFARDYRTGDRGRVVPHTDGVRLTRAYSQHEARRRLDIPVDEPLLVCPGFLHPDKGFDRAVAAFARVGRGRLVIVGEVRDPTPENLAHAEALRRMVEPVAGASLLDRFVPDEEFDAWVAAADAVVLPYRRSWSSGALARAQLLGTPAIVARVGGLAEQAVDRDLVVEDDDGLVEAIARICGRGATEGVG